MKRIVLIFVLLSMVLCGSAQNINELQKRKARALENLKATSNLISENNQTTNKTLSKINLISAELKERQVVIDALEAEMGSLRRQLRSIKAEQASQSDKLEQLKKEYILMSSHYYYNKGRLDDVLFVLSASDVAQAFRRYRYIRQYAHYCEQKGEEIQRVQAELEKKEAEYKKVYDEKEAVGKQLKAEQSKTSAEKQKQKKLVTQLKKKDKELKRQLKKQQAVADKLNAQIEKMIADEAKKNKKGKDGKYVLTKEEKLVSGNFEKNQGRLPWPVEKGLVVGAFGIQPHPVLEHVTVNNKGIHIQCPKGTKARAVFDGEVTQCFSLPGSNTTVIVKHGLYRTVYSNLVSVTVKNGDKVKAKQNIGTIYSDPDEDNKTVLVFQVWKDRTVQNPEIWLAK